MTFNEQQRKDFEEAARPLMAFLGDLGYPHMTVLVDCSAAVLSEGVVSFATEDYVKD